MDDRKCAGGLWEIHVHTRQEIIIVIMVVPIVITKVEQVLDCLGSLCHQRL